MFRAYNPDEDKLVAVKWFRLDLPPERTHRLVAELEHLIASDLTNPAIVAPIGTGIVGASAYLAQDFVAADSVDMVVRQHGPAPPAEALRIVALLAGALDFAAAADVVHGALHPRDVLVSPDDARLTGMGIARALVRAGAAPPVRRPYSAPERADGTAGWDRRADIFSLAALVHEWLWTKRVTGVGRQAADALPPLPGADSAALHQLFARALAHSPDERFDTAQQFADALKAALAGVPGAQAEAAPSRTRGSTLPAHGASEPRLPLDGPGELIRVKEAVPVGDLDLQAVESSPIDQDEGESAAIVAPAVVNAPLRRPEAAHPAPRQDRGRELAHRADRSAQPESASAALGATRSAVWPLGVALVLGVSLGFAAGYEVASWQRQAGAEPAGTEAPAPAASANAGSSARDFTENAVTREPGPAEAAAAGTGATLTPNAMSAPPAKVSEGTASPSRAVRPLPNPRVPPAAARASVAAATPTGRLLIRSTPAGARVLLDGKDVGETPLTIRDLARGAHTVRLVRDGYVAEQRRVVISAGRPAQSITVELASDRPASPPPQTPRPGQSLAALQVESRPAGASVFLDGQLVGKTPLELGEVSAGEHAVRLELDGYRRWSSSVRVAAGERSRVAASLDR